MVCSTTHGTAETDLMKDLGNAFGADPRHASDECQILEQRQLAPQRGLMSEEGDTATHIVHGIITNGSAEDTGGPDGRAGERGKNPQQGSLSGTIRAGDPDHLPGPDHEVHCGQHRHPPEAHTDSSQFGDRV